MDDLPKPKYNDLTGDLILWSRYLLVPIYLGMSAMLLAYVWSFFREIWISFHTEDPFGTENMLLAFLGFVDMSMVANFIEMTTMGGYHIFVKQLHVDPITGPRVLNNMSSGTLKIKMSGSLIGVSAVHLLKDSWVTHPTWEILGPRLVVHAAFIVSALAFTWIEGVLHPAHPEPKPTH